MAEPKTVKMMLISGISYNDAVALERELLWYSDQLLYRASLENAKVMDLEVKLEGMQLISAVADKHANIHRQMLNGLVTLNADEDLDHDKRIITLSYTRDEFECIVGALNSPFIDPKKSKVEGNYWFHLDIEGDERKAFRRHHTAIVRAFKQATTLTTEKADDVEDTTVSVILPDPSDMALATMPRARGIQ